MKFTNRKRGTLHAQRSLQEGAVPCEHPQLARLSQQQLDGEEWLPIGGTEGRYEVSTLGRIWDTSTGEEQLPVPWFTTRLWHVKLTSKHAGTAYPTVASKVCQAFHGTRPVGRACTHLNGNARDNRIENLEWT